ncbi:hypothetical protein L6V77_15970 [Myxococcota bacterium]|nr:hypothetical protein [Myxococcota bacterium]
MRSPRAPLAHATSVAVLAAVGVLFATPAAAGPDMKRRNWVTRLQTLEGGVTIRNTFGRLVGLTPHVDIPACPAGQVFMVIDVVVAPSHATAVTDYDRPVTDLGAWSFRLETQRADPAPEPLGVIYRDIRSPAAWARGAETARLEIPAGFRVYEFLRGVIVGQSADPAIRWAKFDLQYTGACGTP